MADSERFPALKFLAARARDRRKSRKLDRTTPPPTSIGDHPSWRAARIERNRLLRQALAAKNREALEALRDRLNDERDRIDYRLAFVEHQLDPEKQAETEARHAKRMAFRPLVEALAADLADDAAERRSNRSPVDLRPFVNAVVAAVAPATDVPKPKDARRRARLLADAMERLGDRRGLTAAMVRAMSEDTLALVFAALEPEARHLAGLGATPEAATPGPSQDAAAQSIALTAMDLYHAATGLEPTVGRRSDKQAAPDDDPEGGRTGDPGSDFAVFLHRIFQAEAETFGRSAPRGWEPPALRALPEWRVRRTTAG